MSDNDEAARKSESIGASPSRISNPAIRLEVSKALVWVGVVGLALLLVQISQALLVIFGALVFAVLLDGGARLIGKVLPLPRALRVMLVLVLAAASLVWLFYSIGSRLSQEAEQLPAIIATQFDNLLAWADDQGLNVDVPDMESLANYLMSGMGTVTSVLGGMLGGLVFAVLILIIGIYVAMEPKLYERGVAWMVVRDRREEFLATCNDMARTMRRLLAGRLVGMALEGFLTFALLSFVGVPMAALLGLITAVLSFIPNIGAFTSGVLMVLVGFSVDVETGLFAIGVWATVQTLDGYVIVPMIARKTVELAPALVLSAQLIMGLLFGFLGLLLADPLLAMIKVALERRASANDAAQKDAKDAAAQIEGRPGMEGSPIGT